MFALDDRRKRAQQFLESTTCSRLVEWDAGAVQPGVSDVQVYSRLGWRDASRVGRACELVDREMRRCGRVYQEARAESGVDESQVLSRPHSHFLKLLSEYPPPLPSGAAGLLVAEAKAPPLTMRLVPPVPEDRGLFAYAPALTLGYAMSAFGSRFSIEWMWGRTILKSDLPLEWLQDFLESGNPSFDIEGKRALEADDIPEANFRTISRAGSDRDDVHVVVQRFAGGNVDLYHAWIRCGA
nr:hypothetical protein [Actinomycetes bacterium]